MIGSSDPNKETDNLDLIAFMQECRERTTDMKDEEKCKYCKLRFRCYTEIKVSKKKKKNTRKLGIIYELEKIQGKKKRIRKEVI